MTGRAQVLRLPAALCLGLATWGCAQLGSDQGGASNLPNPGIVPQEKVQVGSPPGAVVLAPTDPKLRFLEPHAQVVDGEVDLYVEVLDTRTGRAHIARARSDDGGLSFGEPRAVLQPDPSRPWLGARVGAPSLSCHAGRCLLAFAFGDEAGVAVAEPDPGGGFLLPDAPALVPASEIDAQGVGSPSLVATESGLALYYTARGSRGTVIALAVAEPGGRFERRGVVLAPGEGCLRPSGEPTPCWDGEAVAHPDLRPGRSGTGRRVLRMFYDGSPGRAGGLGFAATFAAPTDPSAAWSRFPFNPVLDEAESERQPSQVRLGERYLLFYLESASGKVGVALAVDDAGLASVDL